MVELNVVITIKGKDVILTRDEAKKIYRDLKKYCKSAE